MASSVSRCRDLPKWFVGCVIILSIAASASARDFTIKGLHITHPFARPTVAGTAAGAIYLTIENSGKETDWLVKASSPIVQTVELHSMTIDGGIMRMREVAGIEIPPGKKVTMTPGGHEPSGFHLMLNKLTKPLKEGDEFPLTLTFRKAGTVEVSVAVESDGSK
jgi:periplasmic copper chaperone A